MPISLALKSRRQFATLLSCAAAATILTATACTKHTSGDELATLPVFHLSDAPTFTLVDDSTPARSFTRITARRMTNGNVAVADVASRRIAIFNRQGTVAKEVTHRGSGPGEQEQMFNFSSDRDTLLAFETAMVALVNVFDANNGFIERFKPTASNWPRRLTAIARLPDDTWLVRQGSEFRILTVEPPIGELQADTLTLGILTREKSKASATVTWLPPIVKSWSIGVRVTGAPVPSLPEIFPFKGAVKFAASDNQVWLADAESGVISIFDVAGRLRFTDTLSLVRRPFQPEDLSAAKAEALATAKSTIFKELIEGRFSAETMPRLMPLLSNILPGADGEMWLQLYEIAPASPQTFIAVSRTGNRLGQLTIPAGLRVQQFGRDFVLALSSNEVDLETVVEYSIRR